MDVLCHTCAPHYDQVELAKAQGADVAELRLDYLEEFDPETDLQVLISESVLPVIITMRPTWEGCVLVAFAPSAHLLRVIAHRGKYAGLETARLAILKFAAVLKAPYVDVEFEAALPFYAGTMRTMVVMISLHTFDTQAGAWTCQWRPR